MRRTRLQLVTAELTRNGTHRIMRRFGVGARLYCLLELASTKCMGVVLSRIYHIYTNVTYTSACPVTC